jgi:hypothetical protein
MSIFISPAQNEMLGKTGLVNHAHTRTTWRDSAFVLEGRLGGEKIRKGMHGGKTALNPEKSFCF